MHPTVTSPFKAIADVLGRRIVKHGAADNAGLQAAAATDKFAGVSSWVGAKNGQTLDVIQAGRAPIEYGGPVTRGDPLTSDAQGRAIVAAPAAGQVLSCIGTAQVSGVLGDHGDCLVAPFLFSRPSAT